MFSGVCGVFLFFFFFSESEIKLGAVTSRALFAKMTGGVSVSQIRLDLVHMGTHGPAPAPTGLHSSRDGGSCGRGGRGAGLILQQLNKHGHLWAQP